MMCVVAAQAGLPMHSAPSQNRQRQNDEKDLTHRGWAGFIDTKGTYPP